MQVLDKWPRAAIMFVADVVQQALPHAEAELCVRFGHCSHEVEVVGVALHPRLYECTALAVAGSPQLLLDAHDEQYSAKTVICWLRESGRLHLPLATCQVST